MYINGIDGLKWVCCNKCKNIYHVVCVCPNQKEPTKWPFSAPFWNANSKWVEVDLPKSRVKQVIFKWVTISVAVVKQKVGKPRPPKEPQRGKDGRKIGVRQKASSGKGKKEQQWQEKDMERAFNLWEENDAKQAKDKLSKRQIDKECGIPYTTFCERVSGRCKGGKRGKIAGGKRDLKILNQGEQAGNVSSG